MDKISNKVRNLLALVSVMSMATMARAAEGDSAFDTIMDAVDLSGISIKVVAAAVVIVGIALAFKGPDIAKRVIRKV